MPSIGAAALKNFSPSVSITCSRVNGRSLFNSFSFGDDCSKEIKSNACCCLQEVFDRTECKEREKEKTTTKNALNVEMYPFRNIRVYDYNNYIADELPCRK